jgi:hypothetical protein
MKNEDTFITDFELKEDLVESFTNNQEIHFVDLGLKDKIKNMSSGTLLEVNKKIDSSITILSVKEVDDELVSSFFK